MEAVTAQGLRRNEPTLQNSEKVQGPKTLNYRSWRASRGWNTSFVYIQSGWILGLTHCHPQEMRDFFSRKEDSFQIFQIQWHEHMGGAREAWGSQWQVEWKSASWAAPFVVALSCFQMWACGHLFSRQKTERFFSRESADLEGKRLDPGIGGKAGSECNLTLTNLQALPILKVEKGTSGPCLPSHECTYSLN